MPLDLTSTKAKLDWAKHHIDSLNCEVDAWYDVHPYGVVPDVNSDFTRYSIRAKRIQPSPSLERWTLMVGDCLHNLRCALDHLIYAFAIFDSGVNPPPKSDALMFPICDTPDRFQKDWPRRLGELGSKFRDAIEFMQPYNRQHTSMLPPLSVLRNLVNADKHRLLRLAFTSVAEGKVSLVGQDEFEVVDTFAHYGEIEDDTEILALTVKRPCPNLHFERMDFEVIVSLWHGNRDSGEPPWKAHSEVTTVMRFLLNEVEHVIKTLPAMVK